MAGGLLAAPLAAEAQEAAKVARIGFLATNLAASSHMREAFRQGLRDLSHVEGRNLVIGECAPARVVGAGEDGLACRALNDLYQAVGAQHTTVK